MDDFSPVFSSFPGIMLCVLIYENIRSISIKDKDNTFPGKSYLIYSGPSENKAFSVKSFKREKHGYMHLVSIFHGCASLLGW